MTDCAEALSLIEKLSDGEATAAEERAAESHLEECSSCRSHLEFLVSLSQEGRSMSFPEPPESYWEHLPRRVLDRIDSGSRETSAAGFWSRVLAPSMLRWGAVGATLILLVTVSVALLRENSGTLTPPPPSAAPAEKRGPEPRVAAEPSAPPSMARDEAAPRADKLESDGGAGAGEREVAESVPPAAAAESPREFEAAEVTGAPEQSDLRKENVQALENAYRPRAAPAAAALSRAIVLETCDELRRAVAAMGDGPEKTDVRYRLAVCSLERQEREASEELRKAAIEDAEAFLAVEGKGSRADGIRARLERIQPEGRF